MPPIEPPFEMENYEKIKELPENPVFVKDQLFVMAFPLKDDTAWEWYLGKVGLITSNYAWGKFEDCELKLVIVDPLCLK